MHQAAEALKPVRRRLPDERRAIIHRFVIDGQKGYLQVGLFEDGTLGELFIDLSKSGSTISGWADVFAIAISRSLQYGDPLEELVKKFSHIQFEPCGRTNNPQIPYAKSVIDYLFQWLALKFLSAEAIPPPPRNGEVEK